MYRQPLRLLTVLCLLGIAPAFAAQVSAESGPLPSSVTSVAAATGSVRQPSSSVRSSARPAQRQWQGNPARKGYDDFRNKQPAAAAPAIVSEPPATEPPPPPPPPKRKVAVTFRGVRTALTGKVYAMLEISDSEEGASSVFLQQGAPLAFGPSVHAVTEEALTLEFPETGKQATIPYGETEIFTLEPKP